MYLNPRKLNTIDDVIDLPGYAKRAYSGSVVRVSIAGIESTIPILIVYQNKNDSSDVLVDVRFENVVSGEQTMLKKEFLEGFLVNSPTSKYNIVEKNGRMFFAGYQYDNGWPRKNPSRDLAYATYACHFLHYHSTDMMIALKHEKVVTLDNSVHVKNLLEQVNEFKRQIPDDSWDNKYIANLEEYIKEYQNEIARLDKVQNTCCEEIEQDKVTFDKYGINWKNFLKED